MKEVVKQHDEDITEIKDDLNKFRDNTNRKLDDIMKIIQKPIFTTFQAVGLVSGALCYVVLIMVYGSDIKSDVRVNTVEISNSKELRQLQTLQNEKIMDALDLIQVDIAVLKNSQ